MFYLYLGLTKSKFIWHHTVPPLMPYSVVHLFLLVLVVKFSLKKHFGMQYEYHKPGFLNYSFVFCALLFASFVLRICNVCVQSLSLLNVVSELLLYVRAQFRTECPQGEQLVIFTCVFYFSVITR